MTSKRGERVYAVFEAALNRDAAGRAALLRELCAGDPELRAEVERLLTRDAEAERDRFLATPASTDHGAPRRGSPGDWTTDFHRARSPGRGEPRAPATSERVAAGARRSSL